MEIRSNGGEGRRGGKEGRGGEEGREGGLYLPDNVLHEPVNGEDDISMKSSPYGQVQNRLTWGGTSGYDILSILVDCIIKFLVMHTKHLPTGVLVRDSIDIA